MDDQKKSEAEKEAQSPDYQKSSLFKEASSEEFVERFDTKKLFLGVQRHLGLAIASMILFGLLGGWGTYHFLTTYKAQAVVLYQQDIPKTLPGGYLLSNFTLPTVLDLIKLRSNFQAIKSMLGLDLSLKELEAMVDVSTPRNNSDLIHITARGDNQNLVIDIANTLAKLVVKTSQEFYRRQLQTALDNFKNELEIIRQRLALQVQEIEDFKKSYQYFEMNAEYAGLLAQLNEARTKYDNSALRYNSLLVEYENLKREAANLPPERASALDLQSNPLQSRVLGLQTALAEARAKYTKDNPKIKLLENEINDLLKQLKNANIQNRLREPNSTKEKLNIELMRMQGRVRAAQKIKQDLALNLSKIEKQLANLPSQQMAFSKLLHAKQITEEQMKFLNNAVESTQLMINVPRGSIELYQLAEKALPLREGLFIELLPIIGMIFGLGFGMCCAIFLEMQDQGIWTIKQVELSYHLPCLLVIPEIPSLTKITAEDKVLFFIRILAERLERVSKKNTPFSVVFTSSLEGEGKSFLAYHLARYYSSLNKKVIFIEFDYHKNPFLPQLPQTYCPVESYLKEEIPWEEVIIPGKPDLIVVGQTELHMKELIKSKNMQNLMDHLKSSYEIIIIDGPGIIQEDFSPNLISFADLSVFVIGSTVVKKNTIDESLRELENYGIKPCGIVLNHVLPVYIDDERIKIYTKKLKNWKVRSFKTMQLLIYLMFSLFFLSGCCCCSFQNFLDSGRRPQVMVCWEDCVIDYTPCDCEEILEQNDLSSTPLTPELLNPYDPLDKEYRIAIGDVLEISIFGDEETSIENVVVAPDGYVYYTFLDAIPAIGKTISELRKEIASKLSHLFTNPMVTIVPSSIAELSYKVLGRVNQPGLYPIDGPIRLRDAIGRAGGVLREDYENKGYDSPLYPVANLRDSFIIRNGKKLDIDFEKLMFTSQVSQNIYIRPGDYIYIAGWDIREVYVLGAVQAPIAIPWYRSLTLVGAIANASGWYSGHPYSADIRKILVLRGPLECPCVIHIDLCKILNGEALDLYLKPNDIVYVYNKEFRFARELIRTAIYTFVQSFATAAASYYGLNVLFPPWVDTTTETTQTTTTTTEIVEPTQ